MSSCASTIVLDVVRIALPAAIVVAGWWVVYRLQGQQSRRRLIREQVEQARKLVKTIRETAITFHTAPFDSVAHEALLEHIAELDDACQLLPKIARSTSRWLPDAAGPSDCTVPPETIARLRQSVTLQHFDEPQQAALRLQDEQILQIREAARQTLICLDQIAITALD